jgi:hypothetical protein
MKTTRVSGKGLFLVAVAGAAILIPGVFGPGPQLAAAATPSARIPHRVVAVYFHRTKRCPTCRRISAYIEEAVNSGFAKQIKDGRVSMQLIDFQNPKNRKFTKYFKIAGPTLVLVDVRDGKVAQWKPMPKVWSLVLKKEKFFRYVQDEVLAYLKEK